MSRLPVNPTRIELRRCKTRLRAAKNGHKLLKDKSDEMVRRFLELVREAGDLRAEAEKSLKSSQKSFAVARAVSDGQVLEQAFCMPAEPLNVEISLKMIMGISVPAIRLSGEKTVKKLSLPYALASAPPELDNAVLNFSDILKGLMKLAEVEKACALLAAEIERTRRRVNALEYIVIPQLEETIKFIQLKLDENERGALVRLMKVKAKLEGKEG
jgi:V/A-type H+-transporting ATPase subunit D